MTAVLEVDHLVKRFRTGFLRKEITAVHDVSFRVEAGETFGLLGPNGAGKTTTMKVLVGLSFKSGGAARIFGEEVPSRKAAARIGYLAGDENTMLSIGARIQYRFYDIYNSSGGKNEPYPFPAYPPSTTNSNNADYKPTNLLSISLGLELNHDLGYLAGAMCKKKRRFLLF